MMPDEGSSTDGELCVMYRNELLSTERHHAVALELGWLGQTTMPRSAIMTAVNFARDDLIHLLAGTFASQEDVYAYAGIWKRV